jgi:hypothetical protein
MAKLSAIMCVYNEEKLIPLVLANIKDHVDEIVIVDGSADGVSTDKTAEIAKACDKVVYKSGTYNTIDGAWDVGIQRNTGINAAKGDYLMFVSADMFFLNIELLRMAVDAGRSKIMFCSTIEFWLDTKNVRLYSADSDPLTVPSPILEPIIISKELHPRYEGSPHISLDGATMQQRAVIPQTTKFHLGWIRPFRQQVDKHIRHVRQHRWGEHGEKLLSGSQAELPQWSIRHVLGYVNIPSIDFYGTLPNEMASITDMYGTLPNEMASITDMKYNDGVEEVTREFEEIYGYSVFKKNRA